MKKNLFEKTTLWLAALVLLGLIGYRLLEPTLLTVSKAKLTPRPELLVSAQWLSANLDGPELRVVDVRSLKAYQKSHVPGAVHLPPRKLWTRVNGLKGTLPPVPQVQQTFREAGIGRNTIVVAYDDSNGLWASRVFWALDYLGQNNGRVLNGGFNSWSAGGNPVSTEIPQVRKTDLVLTPNQDRISKLPWLVSRLRSPGLKIIDARSPDEYTGKEARSKRGGHIPGALNLNWVNHLSPSDKKAVRSVSEVKALYDAFDLQPDDEIVPYCQTNVRGSHAYLMLKVLGYPNVRPYEGSWEEWGNQPETPVVEGDSPFLANMSIASSENASSGLASNNGNKASGANSLEIGMKMEAVKFLVGKPDGVEAQNACWGEQTVWLFNKPLAGRVSPVKLVFKQGELTEIR